MPRAVRHLLLASLVSACATSTSLESGRSASVSLELSPSLESERATYPHEVEAARDRVVALFAGNGLGHRFMSDAAYHVSSLAAEIARWLDATLPRTRR